MGDQKPKWRIHRSACPNPTDDCVVIMGGSLLLTKTVDGAVFVEVSPHFKPGDLSAQDVYWLVDFLMPSPFAERVM